MNLKNGNPKQKWRILFFPIATPLKTAQHEDEQNNEKKKNCVNYIYKNAHVCRAKRKQTARNDERAISDLRRVKTFCLLHAQLGIRRLLVHILFVISISDEDGTGSLVYGARFFLNVWQSYNVDWILLPATMYYITMQIIQIKIAKYYIFNGKHSDAHESKMCKIHTNYYA